MNSIFKIYSYFNCFSLSYLFPTVTTLFQANILSFLKLIIFLIEEMI